MSARVDPRVALSAVKVARQPSSDIEYNSARLFVVICVLLPLRNCLTI